MAQFVDFPQSNKQLHPHPLDVGKVGVLSVYQQCPKDRQDEYNAIMEKEGRPDEKINYPDGPALVISKWQLSAEELAEVNRTGCVYVHCSGYTHGPIFIDGLNPWTETENVKSTTEEE